MNGARLVMNYRVNAGYIAKDHWHQDLYEGGGRIVGEICHFVDLLQFISGSRPISVRTTTFANENVNHDADNLITLIDFADGSIGSITYTSAG